MPESDDPHYSWLALASVPGIGHIRYRHLIDHFGSPQAALDAQVEELATLKEIGPRLASALKREINHKFASDQIRALHQKGYKLLTMNSPEYPETLRKIYDPPPFLFCDGDPSCLAAANIAMVGSRSISVYGKMMAERLTRELTEAGFTIVSGFARGIDSVAHKTAIECGGKTVAVFGCGLDIIYPPENRALYRDLVLNGCALSEFFLGDRPDAGHFPMRNRLISGLSLGVVIVEAGEKSGALLTAQHALEQGREVFAVPGNINSKTSQGTNRIIKEGAKLVTCAQDILEELKFLVRPSRPRKSTNLPSGLSGAHLRVYEALGDLPLQLDKVVRASGLGVSETLEILLEMELNGYVRQLSGKMFVKQS